MIGHAVAALACALAACGGSSEKPAANGAARAPIGSTTPAPSSSDRDYFPQQTARRDVGSGVTFDVDSLPIGALPEPKSKKSSPVEVTAANESPDAVDLKPGRPSTSKSAYVPYTMRLRDMVVGQIRVQGSWQRLSKDNDTTVYCTDMESTEKSSRSGYYGRDVVELRFEGFARRQGAVVYSVTDAWLDTRSCKIKIDDPVFVPVGEVVPGVLYALRSCARQPAKPARTEDELYDDAQQCTEPNRINLLMPHAQKMVSSSGPKGAPQQLPGISRVILPLHQGTAASFAASIPANDVKDWVRRFGASDALTSGAPDPFVISVEIEQTSEQEKPVAIVFLGAENDFTGSTPSRSRPRPL